MLRERLARRYGYKGPFDPALDEDLNHPARRPLLIESMMQIPDTENRISEIMSNELPEFLLRALDILGVKLLYALGYKSGGIYNIQKHKETRSLPLEQRPVKRTFVLPDGTIVKVV